MKLINFLILSFCLLFNFSRASDFYYVIDNEYNINYWDAYLLINQHFKERGYQFGTGNASFLSFYYKGLTSEEKDRFLIYLPPQNWYVKMEERWLGVSTVQYKTKTRSYIRIKIYLQKIDAITGTYATTDFSVKDFESNPIPQLFIDLNSAHVINSFKLIFPQFKKTKQNVK